MGSERNQILAGLFEQMADLMEIQGEDPFRINTYRKVGRILAELPADAADLLADGSLAKIQGIGKSSIAKIQEFLSTGAISAHQQLLAKFPASLLHLLDVPGLGPKGVKAVYEQLHVKDIEGLKAAIANGSLAALPGFGQKKVAAIAKGIEFLERSSGRIRLDQADAVAGLVTDWLRRQPGIQMVSPAGSLRRCCETIGDVDILVTLSSRSSQQDAERLLADFVKANFVKEPLAAGSTKASALIDIGGPVVQVDVRVVPNASFGAALQYFTGSKQHNVKLREIAIKKGLKLNEYALFEVHGQKEHAIAGPDEKEIYTRLGLRPIDPRLREDRGEIEAAAEGTLPDLIELGQIRGDLHVHTIASDGALDLEELADMAMALGYQYLCITDHSQSSAIANGLDAARLAKQIDRIRRLDSRLKGLTLLAGTEVDILADGRLDYDDKVLADLDFVIASVHSGLSSPREKVTMRTLKAMDNPYVNCIGHPTGRLLGERDAMDLDIAAVIEHAARTHTALEVNANPYRLDLKDLHCRMAIQAGVKLAIGTDSHDREGLSLMIYGVNTAARGWATEGDILNCMTLAQLRRWVAKKRPR
ncbi:MAG: DNA polymerase/3'-5' exonuclease PolX [Sedimentisphaerales bacterium]|nr:DNA polymerase/3'-5' exonuclease PolX [Sedimentisphaerales bacterium]